MSLRSSAPTGAVTDGSSPYTSLTICRGRAVLGPPYPASGHPKLGSGVICLAVPRFELGWVLIASSLGLFDPRDQWGFGVGVTTVELLELRFLDDPHTLSPF
jgi:hypothetical protein